MILWWLVPEPDNRVHARQILKALLSMRASVSRAGSRSPVNLANLVP